MLKDLCLIYANTLDARLVVWPIYLGFDDVFVKILYLAFRGLATERKGASTCRDRLHFRGCTPHPEKEAA